MSFLLGALRAVGGLISYAFSASSSASESSDSERAPGAQWRAKATEEANLRGEAFRESQQAWQAGNKARAKELSNKGKDHGANMTRFNALAAAETFTHNNPPPTYPSSLSQVDLHGLFVTESIEYAEKHIALCRQRGMKETVLITGRGNRSKDGMAKIKPAVERWLVEENLKGMIDCPNEGCVTVVIDVPKEEAGWTNCVIM